MAAGHALVIWVGEGEVVDRCVAGLGPQTCCPLGRRLVPILAADLLLDSVAGRDSALQHP